MFFSGGFFTGFFAALAFYWKLGKEADKKFAQATARWEAGTTQYQKALEIRTETEANFEQNKRNLLKFIQENLKGHIPDDVLLILTPA